MKDEHGYTEKTTVDLTRLKQQIGELHTKYPASIWNARRDDAVASILDDLCPVYLSRTSDFREKVRAIFDNKPGVALGAIHYASWMASCIKSPDDAERLRLGLAAISIENCQFDFRDTVTALAKLYSAAEEAGIDPKPHFNYLATLSEMDTTFERFHEYAILQKRQAIPKVKLEPWVLWILLPALAGYIIFKMFWG